MSRYIKVKGFKLTQPANWLRCGALELRGCDHWVIETNELTWSNGMGIEVVFASKMTFRRNVSSHNGQLGIGGGKCDDSLFEDNITDANNYKLLFHI